MLATAALLSACSPEDDDLSDIIPEEETSSIDSVWYNVTSHVSYNPTEYFQYLLKSYPELSQSETVTTGFNLIMSQLPEGMTFESYSYTYKSIDEKGAEAEVSAALIVPVCANNLLAHELVLDNRFTTTDEKSMPSKAAVLGHALAFKGNPVVVSDLLGFCASNSHPVNYCCPHVSARNSVDAVKAAQFMLSSQLCGKLIKEPMPIYNVGYSQGGYDALAVERYMEKDATDNDKKYVSIIKTYCGAGPYDLAVFHKAVNQMPAYMYSPFIVMSQMSMIAYHSELVDGLTVDELLTDECKALGIQEKINSRSIPNNELISTAVAANGTDIKKYFKAEYLDTEGALYKKIQPAVEAESLIKDWKPTGKIAFFHGKNDDCVPSACTMAAEEAFKGLDNVTFTYDESEGKVGLHSDLTATFYIGLLTKWY